MRRTSLPLKSEADQNVLRIYIRVEVVECVHTQTHTTDLVRHNLVLRTIILHLEINNT